MGESVFRETSAQMLLIFSTRVSQESARVPSTWTRIDFLWSIIADAICVASPRSELLSSRSK
jgi:hypothetical protein